MKFAIGISALSIAILLSACVKDTSGVQTRLVKDIVIDSNSCAIYFTYDAKNRLTSMSQCDTVETYTYSNDTVVDIRGTREGILIYKYIYKLNSAGLASGYTKVGGDGSIASYVFTYDAGWHRLSTLDTTHPNTVDNYTIQNNDVILYESTSSVSGITYSISTFFYNATRNTLGNDNYGLSFLGTSSTNLKKGDIYDGQYTVIYTYILDTQNGVSKQVSTINGVVTDTRYYEYY